MNEKHEHPPVLDPAAARAAARAREAGGGPHVEQDGRTILNFASDDALGLSTDPRVTTAAREAILRWGVGSGAAVLAGGRLTVHDELAAELAAHLGAERVLLFASGWEAGAEAMNALVGPDDLVFADARTHDSLVQGARSAGVAVNEYAHLDPSSLKALLARRHEAGWRVVATDGVFADEARIAPLPDLARTAAGAGALLVVHDASGVGALGPEGRGSAALLGCTDGVALTIGSLGRSLGAQGGFVAGPGALIDRIASRSGALRDSVALAPPLAAAALAALRVSIREPGRRASLERHAMRLREDLKSFGLTVTGDPRVPRVIVHTGGVVETLALADHLEAAGVLALPLVPPRCSADGCGVLLAPMATHTDTDMEDVHMAFASAPPDVLPRGKS